MVKPRYQIEQISSDFNIFEFENQSWRKAINVSIDRYWSGEPAPNTLHFSAKCLWSDSALYVRFTTKNETTSVISEKPNLAAKTMGLWERDVCEIFLAPNREESRKYFEFEIAPTGEWLDLAIHQKPDERITDWDYNSGMTSSAKIGKDEIVMAFKVEWRAFGVETPKAGDIWRGNILRAMGSEPNRSYLAWSPTKTEEPNFHVPEKFGEFVFEK